MARRPPQHGPRHGQRPHRREAARVDPARAVAPRSDAILPEPPRAPRPAAAPAVIPPGDSTRAREPGDVPAGGAGPHGTGPLGAFGPIGPSGALPEPAGRRGIEAAGRSLDGDEAATSPRPGDQPAIRTEGDRPRVAEQATEGGGGRAGADHAPPRREEAPLVRESAGCTAAQLRRFIKSRAWIPMHELRRRFSIDGLEDDVLPVRLANGGVFVGLPERETQMLGDLFRSGDVGFELSHDPESPIVIGVYPMRPVIRG